MLNFSMLLGENLKVLNNKEIMLWLTGFTSLKFSMDRVELIIYYKLYPLVTLKKRNAVNHNIYIILYTYIYKFESHLTMYWINKKNSFKNTFIE